jgi:hypothetical protein
MDTITVHKILSSLFSKRKVTFDVIPCDYLDKINVTRYPLCLCVNNQTSSEPGEHWVGIFVPNPSGPLEFFCSYGIGMSFYADYFKKFAKRMKYDIVENDRCLQSVNSNVCGLYVIYFLFKRANKCPLKCIYAPFSNNVIRNDAIVRRIIHVKTNLLSIKIK